MQGASVKQTRSVCSERARTPAGGRSRCGFAKRTRGFSAQCPSQISMRCRSGVLPRPQPINGFPKPRRIELYAGRERKEKRLSDSDRDTLSQWQLKRKLHPGVDARNGIHFPDDASSGKFIPESALRTGRAFPTAVQTESSSRNPASNWGALSASPAASKNLRALHPKTG